MNISHFFLFFILSDIENYQGDANVTLVQRPYVRDAIFYLNAKNRLFSTYFHNFVTIEQKIEPKIKVKHAREIT